MAGKRVLAFDFGASSGRAILAQYENGRIALQEIHRFSNDPVMVRGVFYWDVLRLFFEIKQGITKALKQGGFDAIGIDTWGVDFGLLDKKGQLMGNPVHYRDSRTVGMMEKVFETIPAEELYRRTGIQFARFNTIFQLAYLRQNEPRMLEEAETMLFMPDLFAYLLTGERRAEYTIASTGQCLESQNRRLGLRFAGAAGYSGADPSSAYRSWRGVRRPVPRHLRGTGLPACAGYGRGDP